MLKRSLHMFHFMYTASAQKNLQGTLCRKITLQNEYNHSYFQAHTRTHTHPAVAYSPCCSAVQNRTPNTHAKYTFCALAFFLKSLCLNRKHTQPHTQTAPLTPEVVVEARHQVEGCVLFRGGFAPCTPCHLVPRTTPRFLSLLMRTLRGHQRQPPGEATLALAPALVGHPHYTVF